MKNMKSKLNFKRTKAIKIIYKPSYNIRVSHLIKAYWSLNSRNFMALTVDQVTTLGLL